MKAANLLSAFSGISLFFYMHSCEGCGKKSLSTCKSQLTTAQIIESKLSSFRTSCRKALCKSAKCSSLLLWMSIMLSRKGVSLIISAANFNEYWFLRLMSSDEFISLSLTFLLYRILFYINLSDTCSDKKRRRRYYNLPKQWQQFVV